MASIKKSVMFSDGTQKYIAARTRAEDEIAWSQSLNEGFKALKWLTDQALPELAAAEWQVILNAYAGSIISFDPPYRVASDLMDDVGAISIEDLEPSYAALVKKIHGMSQLEQYAIMDFVQKFWSRDWNGMSWDEIVRTIKDS